MVNKHFVVVLGAGASRELGQQPVPMMADWADLLFDDFKAENFDTSIIGLEKQMGGRKFEIALGQFLAAQRLITQGFSLLPFYSGLGKPDFDKNVEPWLETAGVEAARAIEIIRKNLVSNFGGGVIAAEKASRAYERFLAQLEGSGVDLTRAVLATTNYDRAIEMALEQLGRPFADGFQSPEPQQIPKFLPEGMIDKSFGHRSMPVLHLHGAVNWYVNANGQVVRQFNDVEYDRAYGTPAILLPDPQKDPGQDDAIGGLWTEFQHAVDECSHLLIIGHGLNDEMLVSSIRERNRPTAWAVPRATKKADELESLLPDAVPIDMSFGPNSSNQALSSWLEEVVA